MTTALAAPLFLGLLAVSLATVPGCQSSEPTELAKSGSGGSGALAGPLWPDTLFEAVTLQIVRDDSSGSVLRVEVSESALADSLFERLLNDQ